MTLEQNKAAARRTFEEAFNRGDLTVIDELVADGVDHQHPDEPSFREHLKAVIIALRTAFPDLHFEVSRLIGEGEWVALHSFMTGTHQGDLRPPALLPPGGPSVVPATGRRVKVAHMHLIRFEDGKGTELWHVMDTMALAGQLGLLPGRQPAASAAAAPR
jgi:predicted ester cyclase